MKCALHNNEDAIAACGVCGLGMCNNCTSEVTANGKKVCPRCGLKILNDKLAARQGELLWEEGFRRFLKSRSLILGLGFIVAVIAGVLTGGIGYLAVTYPLGFYLLYMQLVEMAGATYVLGKKPSIIEKLKNVFSSLLVAPLTVPMSVLILGVRAWWRAKNIPPLRYAVAEAQKEVQEFAKRFGITASASP